MVYYFIFVYHSLVVEFGPSPPDSLPAYISIKTESVSNSFSFEIWLRLCAARCFTAFPPRFDVAESYAVGF